jgi:tol-pal system protein YbgF
VSPEVDGRVGGGRGVTRVHRFTRRALPIALLLAMGTTGCATKRDVRDMRSDLRDVQARQDSIYQLLQMQNRQILDSLTVTTERLLNVRGQLARQLTELQQQLVQVGELTGQVQIRLNQLDQELAGAVGRVAPGEGGPDTAPGVSGGADPGEVRSIYEAGLDQLNLGNAATARRAFQMVVDSFPSDPLAAEAQRQIGDTYAMERQYDEALRAFDRVVERYQDSDAAPRALYRAGVIALERGQEGRARQYFQRVISGYPQSDSRRLAEDALQRMGGG